MVAATPKPGMVELVVTSAGEDALSIGRTAWKAAHFVVKIEIGIAGFVAPLIGKQPPDSHVWILEARLGPSSARKGLSQWEGRSDAC